MRSVNRLAAAAALALSACGNYSTDDLVFWAALPIVLVTAVSAAVLLAFFGAIDAGPGSTTVPVLLTAFERLVAAGRTTMRRYAQARVAIASGIRDSRGGHGTRPLWTTRRRAG